MNGPFLHITNITVTACALPNAWNRPKSKRAIVHTITWFMMVSGCCCFCCWVLCAARVTENSFFFRFSVWSCVAIVLFGRTWKRPGCFVVVCWEGRLSGDYLERWNARDTTDKHKNRYWVCLFGCVAVYCSQFCWLRRLWIEAAATNQIRNGYGQEQTVIIKYGCTRLSRLSVGFRQPLQAHLSLSLLVCPSLDRSLAC